MVNYEKKFYTQTQSNTWLKLLSWRNDILVC